MSVYYLKPEKTVNEIINTIHAGIASMQYFEKMDNICAEIGFDFDDAILLQQIKQLSKNHSADLAHLAQNGITAAAVQRLKTVGLLLFVQDNEVSQSYVILSRKALTGLQAIAASYRQASVDLVPALDSRDVERVKAAADKIFRKYE
ncbi:hypothetical protein [Latilactobacillus graminis]|uniref:Uncharacterized protein n=2 Tax=Latilactobacillus graminis TaxID=60519 RepID=A0AA89I7Z3_9LACO|nr:hypothetical protein [Latilactobacillus graminis]KRM23371.1 hypothetical protein FC90_GL000325 [Latilactobacillus graminis DSM 20719]QFP80278.1 hypothetical protein LG542_08655 [Latilactobacillus graminis]